MNAKEGCDEDGKLSSKQPANMILVFLFIVMDHNTYKLHQGTKCE